nr:toll-like receptor 1 isoform X3 [Nothobranchius furzeri]
MRLLTVMIWAAGLLAVPQMCASSHDSIVDRSSMNLCSVPTDLPQTAEYLDLSCNHIHRIHKGDFKNTTMLRFLNVSWNGLEKMDAETFLDTPHLEGLDLSHNMLTNLSGQQYLLHTGNLVMLNLAWNSFLNMTLGSEFSLLVKLVDFTLGAKNIHVGDFKSLATVKLHSCTLSLEEKLEYEAHSLMGVHAQWLHLDFNAGKLVHSDLIADAFSLFVHVEVRNLTGGYSSLSKELDFYFPYECLRRSHRPSTPQEHRCCQDVHHELFHLQTRLQDLPVCDGLPKLNKLLLKSNSLHAPSLSRLEGCPNLHLLDASHNPFTCTCSLRNFISLGFKSDNKRGQPGIELLAWPHGYHCFYPEALRDSMLKDFWVYEISCNVGLLATAILVPTVALILTILFLCQRLDAPWYIGMIWQWTRAKHRTRKQVRPEDLIGVEFHAFVSYSQHDVEWVKNHLLPNLEGPDLRLCHHEKNFVPGKTITENIISCVEKSRRSLFVLSAHFVKSDWCHYELYFASHQQLSLGTDGIVLVLLEPLPQYLIPSKYYQLKAMMNRHTYLEWPQDRAKHRLFWANLRAALQADLPDVPVTHLQE